MRTKSGLFHAFPIEMINDTTSKYWLFLRCLSVQSCLMLQQSVKEKLKGFKRNVECFQLLLQSLCDDSLLLVHCGRNCGGVHRNEVTNPAEC